ncbi:MAG: anthranilate synthase component I [Planctomycetota bacterium]|nr:anthranilate synthase component I [Planctomycetota bacterium]MDA1180115.1 anthranilate synthase component I [Planctomycetota bacterium]
MPKRLTYDDFAQLAQRASLVPVHVTLLSDSLTPASAFHKLDQGGPACLFESVIGGEKVGRYSFLAWDPFLQMTAFGNHVTRTPRSGTPETVRVADPLQTLRDELAKYPVSHDLVPGLPPFVGGAIGYAGYDVVRYSERLPNPPHDDRQLPDLAFGFYDQLVVFDNVQKTVTVIVLQRTEGPSNCSVAYEESQRRLDRIVQRLSAPEPQLEIAEIDLTSTPPLDYTSNFQPDQFRRAVEKCVEYIRAGDIFQVVISQRLKIPLQVSSWEVYRTLRAVNPSPFMFFLRTPHCDLVGSSPEIMCRVVDGVVTVRPLAGTRPRGRTNEEDVALAEELLADPKERAEHIMLVDLGRNDVGRVAQYGTVKLSDVMSIERYSHVMHITSNVTGTLAPGKDAFDALRASLPAGTVSGAPKVRAMEIIDELEPHRRGPYAGAVGYIDYGGNMDTCIALRTIVVRDNVAYVQAGAGIVADSVAESEFQETLNKARGLLKAIAITEARVSGS